MKRNRVSSKKQNGSLKSRAARAQTAFACPSLCGCTLVCCVDFLRPGMRSHEPINPLKRSLELDAAISSEVLDPASSHIVGPPVTLSRAPTNSRQDIACEGLHCQGEKHCNSWYRRAAKFVGAMGGALRIALRCDHEVAPTIVCGTHGPASMDTATPTSIPWLVAFSPRTPMGAAIC